LNFSTILDVLEYRAKIIPNKVCLIDATSGKECTYGDFWQIIVNFASRLSGLGLKRGKNVIVRVGRVIETLAAQYSINLAGGVYCPVESSLKEPRLLEMLSYFESDILISTEKITFNGKWIDLLTVCNIGNENGLDINFKSPNPDDVCAIVFTTGTTGKSKGVMRTFRSVLVTADANKNAYEFIENSVFYWIQPLHLVSGISTYCRVFIAGDTAVYCEQTPFINEYFNTIKCYKATDVHISAAVAEMILRSIPNAFIDVADQIKTMAFGGSALSEKYKEQLRLLLPKTRLYIRYGATEMPAITYLEFSKHTGKVNCVGKPFSCTKISIFDEYGLVMKNTSINNVGIIACEGGALMAGYWREPELTAITLKDGKIMMTDVGYMDNDGFLYLMGRRDDVIVMGGYKIAPYEIEEVTMQIEGIAECACVPVPNEATGYVPKLFVVMENGYEFSAKKISEYLLRKLEKHKQPRIILEVDSLPKVEGSIKTDRRRLN